MNATPIVFPALTDQVSLVSSERTAAQIAWRVDSVMMERPKQFEEHRWVGDKRTQIVYDVDHLEDEELIVELMASERYLCFGPDTLAEARNRGYRPFKGNGHGSA